MNPRELKRLLTTPRPPDGRKGTSPHVAQGTTPSVKTASLFFLSLAESLHVFGMGAHNLEKVLYRVAQALGVEGQFLVTPTSVVMSLGPAERSRTNLLRIGDQELDLERLTELHRLVRKIVEGTMTVDDARTRLEELRTPRRPWSASFAALAHGVTAAGAAVILQGGWPEVATAGALGLLLGLALHVAHARASVTSIAPLLAATLASAVVGAVSTLVHPLVGYIPTLAAIVTLLPGLSLTVAVNEVAHGHTVAGSARLTGVLMTLLQLGFGVALGQELASGLGAAAAAVPPDALPNAVVAVAAALVVLAFAIGSRARRTDLPLILFTAGLGLVASRVGTVALGPELGACAAAWIVGTAGNAVSRWGNVPSATTVLPALLLLVPGSLGFGSISSLMADDVVVGLQTAVSMLVVALSLVTGLLLASLTTRPADLF